MALTSTYAKHKIFFDLSERIVDSKSSFLIYKTNMLNIGFEYLPLGERVP